MRQIRELGQGTGLDLVMFVNDWARENGVKDIKGVELKDFDTDIVDEYIVLISLIVVADDIEYAFNADDLKDDESMCQATLRIRNATH